MANNAENVTVGKPKITGAIWRAPKGTTLPESTSEALNEAFKCMGYISDSGVKNGRSVSTSKTKAWGGDTILESQTEKNDTFAFKLLEVLNPDVIKAVEGDNNVTGTLETGIEVNVNASEAERAAWVIDMIMSGNTAKRIVISDGQITSMNDIEYSDSNPVGYDITLTAYPDSDGNTHIEYIKKASTPSL